MPILKRNCRISGASTIERYHCGKDNFRVAATDQIAIPWPYDREISPPQVDLIVESVQMSVEEILRVCNIPVHKISTFTLVPRNDFERQHTLIIQTMSEDFERWSTPATAIQKVVDEEISKRSFAEKISVEIRNPVLMYADTSSIVPHDSPEFHLFTEIQERVKELVEKFCDRKQEKIGFQMRGRPRGDEEGLKPTIVIIIRSGSRLSWDTVIDQIMDGLSEWMGPSTPAIWIELLPGRVTSCRPTEMKTAKPVLQHEISHKPQHGSSIGPRGSTDTAGTMGPIVYLQTAPNQPREAYGLTCYHVVRTGVQDKDILAWNDKHGIGLLGQPRKTIITIDFPSPCDAHYSMMRIPQLTAAGDDGTKALQIINHYVSKNGIGEVIYGSGSRRNAKGRKMDWALIKLNDEEQVLCPNRPAAELAVQQSDREEEPYNVAADSTISTIGKLETRDQILVMSGRTSGVRTGEINSLRAIVYWDGATWSTEEVEVQAIRSGGMFADLGDSGSMVYTLDFKWVGMVIGVCSADNMTFVTSAQEIIEDVKDQCSVIMDQIFRSYLSHSASKLTAIAQA